MRKVCSPGVREPTKDDMLLNNVEDAREIFTIAAPQVTRQQDLMDRSALYFSVSTFFCSLHKISIF